LSDGILKTWFIICCL